MEDVKDGPGYEDANGIIIGGLCQRREQVLVLVSRLGGEISGVVGRLLLFILVSWSPSCDLNMLCNCNWPCMTNEAEDRRGTCRNGISRSRRRWCCATPFWSMTMTTDKRLL